MPRPRTPDTTRRISPSDEASNGALRDLFDQVMELSADQRLAWLDEQVTDVQLRESLRRLVHAATDEASGPLETPPMERAARIGRESETPAPAGLIGQRIGAFRLIDIIGQGGMAIVFMAIREGVDFQQHVAVKLLRRGLYSALEQRLFRRERQALAALSHPNIARLIDGGVTDAGIPYLAIEHVDGVPITQHVVERQLDLRDRLKLFNVVCRAVEAAHRHLIVHRDIKPSNILVMSDGTVKLLDFGIAKLLDDGDDNATRTEMTALTPGYAAPEQYTGGPISMATDVYALGVLLHELLLGERPATASVLQRPSSRATELATDLWLLPASRTVLRSALKGDLDNVLLKALATEPERRYPSAADLADDVERHLAARPVMAHPPSRWYRTRKFVQRHRGGVFLTTTLVLAVFASLGLAVWQAGVAREQARQAKLHGKRAEEVSDFLISLFDAQIPARPGEQMPGTDELLRRGVDRAMTTLDDSPALQSSLLVALGRVYDHLAMGDAARPLLDQAINAARKVKPDDPALLAEALSERGELDVARDRHDDAIGWLDQAIAIQRDTVPDSLKLALSLDRRALARSQKGEHDAALADYGDALALRKRTLPPDDPEILHGLHAIGNALLRAGRRDEAASYLRDALSGARRTFGEDHVKTAHYATNYATYLLMAGEIDKATILLEAAVKAERALYPRDHPTRGQGLNNLATAYMRLGRLREALPVLDEAHALNVAAGEHEMLGQTFVLGNRSRIHETRGNLDAALVDAREASRIANQVVGPDHARTLALDLQCQRLETLVNPANAQQLLSVSRALLDSPERLAQFRSRSVTEAGFNVGLALTLLHQSAEADAVWELTTSDADPADPFVLHTIAALALLRADSDANGSMTLLQGWIAKARDALPETHYAIGELHLVLAEIGSKQRLPIADAAQAAQAAFSELPSDHPWHKRLAATRIAVSD